MVSFWPWKSDPSPSSFEKTLSTLSAKISDTQARLDRVRTDSRRIKVLWTLYLGFAYLVYAIVLLLVVGYKNLGAYEWTGVAGGPILIYATRALITSYFSYRIEVIGSRLKSQQQERAKTIQKLKDATKYDSTLELIEKYGGENKAKSKRKDQAGTEETTDRPVRKARTASAHHSGRTNLPPPPTANIVRRDPTPATAHDARPRPLELEVGADFAPNAFSHPPPPAPRNEQPQYVTPETHWYDRIFDVLLGEDETAAKNRYALVCKPCRLVNGQAPPGTKSLAEVGMWRCSGCGATNGEVDEGRRIMEEVLRSKQDHGPAGSDEAEDEKVSIGVDGDADHDETVTTATERLGENLRARRRESRD